MLLAMAGDEFFQILASFGYVFPQSLGGHLGIFRLAGSKKLAMRPAGPVEVTGKDEVKTGVTVTVNVQGLQKREHEWTIGGGIEGGMKTPVPLAPRLHFRIFLQGLFVLNEDILGALEILFPHVGNRMTQHIAFENGARFEHLHDLVG